MANAVPPIPQRVQGMPPEQELQQWAQWRQAVDQAGATNQLDGEAARYYNGPSPRPGDPKFDQMYATDLFSPEAGQTYLNAKTHFDLNSGKVEKNKSGWDLPETKLIVALAAGMGGGVIAPALLGAYGASAAAPEIATTSSGAVTGVAAPTAAGLSAGTGGTTAAATGALGGASTLGKVAGMFKNGSASDILGAAGAGIGGATNAAANNRLTSGELAQRQQQANTSAQSAYENELMARAKEEQAQRSMALKQSYAASYAHNRTPGPNNTAGLTQYSPDYLANLDSLASQSNAKLGKTAQYDTDAMTPLKPTAMDLDEFMKKYGQPSTMEKVGNWLSPTLSTIGKVAKYF